MARKPASGPASDPELLILSSLASGPNHGYGIMSDIETFADVTLGAGTLYTAITTIGGKETDRAGFVIGAPAPLPPDRIGSGESCRTAEEHAARRHRRPRQVASRMSARAGLVRILLLAYPLSWRREYGAELEDILLTGGIGPLVVGDVIVGGLTQRIRFTDVIVIGILMGIGALDLAMPAQAGAAPVWSTPWAVATAPLFRLPAAWVFGAFGGQIGRWIARVRG